MDKCWKCGLVTGACFCGRGSSSGSFVNNPKVLDPRFDPMRPVYEDVRRRTCNPLFMKPANQAPPFFNRSVCAADGTHGNCEY